MATSGADWRPGLSMALNRVYDLVAVTLATVGTAVLEGDHLGPQLGAFTLFALAVWSAGSFVVSYYDPWAEREALDESALLLLLSFAVAVVLWFLQVSLDGYVELPAVSHLLLVLWPMVLAPRLLLFRRLALREQPLDEVLVVGAGPLGRCTAEDLQLRPRARRRVVGFLAFASDARADTVEGVPVLGRAEELEQVLRTRPVSEVYLAGHAARDADALQAAIRTCERLGVPFALPACSFRLGRARALLPGSSRDGYIHYVTHAPHHLPRAFKRLFDIVVSASALLALAPLLLVVAALVKLTSRGPIFFKQVRVGLHGRQFHMFKFRTMVVNAEALREKLLALNEQAGPVFKMKKDPRITRVGGFLRKHSIDELPQLINVLRGDMSIVGPRPPIPKEVAQYEAWQYRRLSVRPGLTCIWQVSGRNEISFEEWMYLDMRYIDHWSLSQDIGLILKTVPVVLTGRGAS
ncbi:MULTISPECIES: sugar transferase [Myxococcaceae]|uniref:sugar transferase n=1 Tax=Myxococcaceae TaxID=31 RepID=UPI001E3ED242|nr:MULTISPECIES: sugar transferase [Myxococcaceae]